MTSTTKHILGQADAIEELALLPRRIYRYVKVRQFEEKTMSTTNVKSREQDGRQDFDFFVSSRQVCL